MYVHILHLEFVLQELSEVPSRTTMQHPRNPDQLGHYEIFWPELTSEGTFSWHFDPWSDKGQI